MRIIFMGTPDFAVNSLVALKESGEEIIAVFCQPDKPQGRKQILTPPEVKVKALEYGFPVFQPKTLKDSEPQQLIKELAPDLIIVAAYGKILPIEVLSVPKYGCINVHGSLLPKYRGAAPIQRAIIEGDTVTGVTIMQMGVGMDVGDMLLVKEVPINPDETAGELFVRLADIGACALIEVVTNLDAFTPIPQNHDLATWASPLTKEDGLLDFNLDATVVYARLRGVSPWPGGVVIQNGKRLKIIKAELCDKNGEVGTLLDSKNLIIACKTGSLNILEVAPEGSKKQEGKAFINGQRLSIGDKVF